MTDDTFLHSRQLPSFRVCWARHRLNYLQHVAQHGAVFQKALLHLGRLTNTGWLMELQDDLAWLQTLHSLSFDIPTDRPMWVEAWEMLCSCKSWKSWIKTACRKHLLQEKIAWEVSYLHDQILAELTSTGMQLLDNKHDPDPAPCFSCHHCDAHFTSHQQRAPHEYRIHQVIAEERCLVQSTMCGGCLKDFHKTFRVTQHLRHRPNRCWSRLAGVKAPAEPITVQPPDHQRGVPRIPAVRRHHQPFKPTPHHRERLRVRTEIQQQAQEGDADFAWWDPLTRPDLLQCCFHHFVEGLRQWETLDAPAVVDFHNIYFNLFFSLDLPDFQVAPIFIHWIEMDFQELHCHSRYR